MAASRHVVVSRVLIAVSVWLMVSASTFAATPSLDLSQFGHAAWTATQGFFDGVVRAITQTQDGYLWLGTELGLVRFDGVRAVPWTFPLNQRLASNSILSLLATRDGSLWIGTTAGLARWKAGMLTQYAELAGVRILALAEDRTGTVWAGSSFRAAGANLCEIRDQSLACFGSDGTLGPWVRAIFEDPDGRLWVHASTGLWQWVPGARTRYPLPSASTWFETSQPLAQGDTASTLILVAGGLRSFSGGQLTSYATPGVPEPFTPLHVLRTSDGALWIGTLERGLVRIAGRTSTLTQRDGLSSDHIFSLFQDREGNVWVGTAQGLDRFSELTATPIPVDQALSGKDPMTVLATHDGSVWMGTMNGLSRRHGSDVIAYRDRDGLPGNSIGSLVEDDRGRVWASTDRGLARFENGKFHRVTGVPALWVNAITADGGAGVWISDQDRGLLHVVDDRVVQQMPWSQLAGDGAPAAVLVADRARGGLWLGFFRGGVIYLKDGHIEASYQVSDGLGQGRVMGLHLDSDGAVWAATWGGLSRIADGRVATLTSRNGLPCDTIHWIVDDERASYWLYTACGLVQIPKPALQRWASDSTKNIEARVYDASDGIRSRALFTGFTPRVSPSSDGRVWFVNVEGVSFVDPMHLPTNAMPPAVRIEQVRANQHTFDASAPIRMPGTARDVEIEYTALSLVAPEKNRFRIKLEGYDPDWQDVGSRREAFYTNLPPRQYRFRVAAANNSGVWNETGAAVDFAVSPRYYQTIWFRAIGFAGVCALLWALHQLRLRQIAAQFDARLQERVYERTRIARELHDTLLQSLHGLMFQFQAARNMLPERTGDAMHTLDGAILRTEQAIAESRDAIVDLRSSSGNERDLGRALAAFGQELLSAETQDVPRFHVTVEGAVRPLPPVLHDEVCRIARELVRNAFRHARAQRVEAEIRYEDRQLRLRIRDDGAGINPKVLQDGGRSGHWGLKGIRERAQAIGAELDVWSQPGAGTEVQLGLPAAIAYRTIVAPEAQVTQT